MELITEVSEKKTDLEELSVERSKAEGRKEQAIHNIQAAGFEDIEAAKDELKKRIAKKETAEAKTRQFLADIGVRYADFIE